MAEQQKQQEPENLGQLIERRMDDLGIPSLAALGRLMGGKSRSYMSKIAKSKPTEKGKTYIPDPDILKLLASVLRVSEAEVLKAAGIWSPTLPELKSAPDIREASFAFFGGGRNLTKEEWEEVIAVSQAMINEKERRKKKKKV